MKIIFHFNSNIAPFPIMVLAIHKRFLITSDSFIIRTKIILYNASTSYKLVLFAVIIN